MEARLERECEARVAEASRASFVTGVPPRAEHRGDIRFVVFGDSRSRSALDYDPASTLRQCRSRLSEAIQSEDVDFVINTGDMVKTASQELWRYFAEDTAELLRPRFFYPTLGNHEYKGDPGDQRHYFELFEPMIGNLRSYAFAYGEAYVIVLDTFARPLPVQSEKAGNEHAAWFRRQLVNARDSRVLIVALHYPVLSSGSGSVARLLARPVELLLGRKREGHSPLTWAAYLREDLVEELAARAAGGDARVLGAQPQLRALPLRRRRPAAGPRQRPHDPAESPYRGRRHRLRWVGQAHREDRRLLAI